MKLLSNEKNRELKKFKSNLEKTQISKKISLLSCFKNDQFVIFFKNLENFPCGQSISQLILEIQNHLKKEIVSLDSELKMIDPKKLENLNNLINNCKNTFLSDPFFHEFFNKKKFDYLILEIMNIQLKIKFL